MRKFTILFVTLFSLFLVATFILIKKDNLSRGLTLGITSIPYSIDYRDRQFKNLAEQIQNLNGTFSLVVESESESASFKYNESYEYYAASLYKVPLAVASLNYASSLSDHEKGIFYNNVYSLLNKSDNYAQQILTYALGQSRIKESFIVLTGFKANTFYEQNSISAFEYVDVLREIERADYIAKPDKEFINNALTNTAFEDRVVEHLSEKTVFVHKIGNWPNTGTWHDCGVVIKESGDKFYVCLMSENTTLQEFKKASKLTAGFINTL